MFFNRKGKLFDFFMPATRKASFHVLLEIDNLTTETVPERRCGIIPFLSLFRTLEMLVEPNESVTIAALVGIIYKRGRNAGARAIRDGEEEEEMLVLCEESHFSFASFVLRLIRHELRVHCW